jgi:hypothetical protein
LQCSQTLKVRHAVEPQNDSWELRDVVIALKPVFVTPVTTNLQPLPVEIRLEVDDATPLPRVVFDVVYGKFGNVLIVSQRMDATAPLMTVLLVANVTRMVPVQRHWLLLAARVRPVIATAMLGGLGRGEEQQQQQQQQQQQVQVLSGYSLVAQTKTAQLHCARNGCVAT